MLSKADSHLIFYCSFYTERKSKQKINFKKTNEPKAFVFITGSGDLNIFP